MIVKVAIFLLGVIVGVVSVMVISVLVVDSMNHKKTLTKEEWKMGIHPDYAGGSGSALVAYAAAAVVTVLVLYIVLR